MDRLDRLQDPIQGTSEHSGVEGRDHLAPSEPTEVSPVGSRDRIGGFPQGHLGEVDAVQKLLHAERVDRRAPENAVLLYQEQGGFGEESRLTLADRFGDEETQPARLGNREIVADFHIAKPPVLDRLARPVLRIGGDRDHLDTLPGKVGGMGREIAKLRLAAWTVQPAIDIEDCEEGGGEVGIGQPTATDPWKIESRERLSWGQLHDAMSSSAGVSVGPGAHGARSRRRARRKRRLCAVRRRARLIRSAGPA